MYEDFYGLTERPFTLIPDPEFLYLSPQHKLARAYLEYGINQRVGFVVLTGEVGTGKTTLIKSLLRQRERNLRLGVLYQTSVGADDLLEWLLKEFEVPGRFLSHTARLGAFNQFLLTAYARGEHVVLLVDEAQNLCPEALEELRLLSNLQAGKEPLLQVILIGHPGLRERLRHPALRQLAQRVAVHYHLTPLDRHESKEYIRFRLARAGGSGIFAESALDKLYDYTQGVPRRLNTWSDLALVAGFAEGRQEIDGDFIDMVYATQGGSLEGPEEGPLETPAGLEAAAGALEFNTKAVNSNNGLEARLSELSGRLTRIESLVLEITSQLIPVLTRVMLKPPPQEIKAPPEVDGRGLPLRQEGGIGTVAFEPLPQEIKTPPELDERAMPLRQEGETRTVAFDPVAFELLPASELNLPKPKNWWSTFWGR
ncbi:MAG: ExeA family protein [Desulfobaccales bacterium]